MFESKPRDIDKEMKRLEAEKAVSSAMLDLMLATLPEEARLDLEVLKAHAQLMDASQKAVIFFSKDVPSSTTPEFVEAQKAIRDYLTDTASNLTAYLDEAKKNLNAEHENQ